MKNKSSVKIYLKNGKIKISHIFLILTFKSVIFTQTFEAIKIKCTNADDFFFTSPGSQCRSYYRCISKGQKETEECSQGMKFDFYQQTCSHSPGNCGEPSCIGRSNGIYQDTTHACMRSFTCYAGKLTSLDNCPPKHLHNGQKCVQQDLVNCSSQPKHANNKIYENDKRCVNHLEHGAYATDHSCREYVVCRSGEVNEARTCPYDYLFDAVSQQCLPKHKVRECGYSSTLSIETLNDEICRNRKDGPVMDPTSQDCSTYIICKSGRNEGQRRCSNQAVFNGESCVPSILHQCSITKRHIDAQGSDQCYQRSNGYYANPQYGCSSYIKCVSECVIEVGVCPDGQYFDMEIRKCFYERNLERRRCFERGISNVCASRADGFYAESKCENYYYCHNGHKIEYKCIAGKVFNGKECVLKWAYKCPKISGDTFCHARPDDYYMDHNDGCRTYNYCSNGHKMTYLCELGHLFDNKSKKCVRKDQLSYNYCHADHICYGKSDGYHADLQSNCRNYVFCKNYEKITQLTCRNDKIFNGFQCVDPIEYACPSLHNHRQVNCVPRSCLKRCETDGFYADLSSDCRDYYFCISGKSSKISCPAGKRFNGEICIAEDQFICPVVCTHKNETEDVCPLSGYVA